MVKLVIIGHTAFDYTETPKTKALVPGGAAYYTATGASRFSDNIGIVSPVGEDFDFRVYEALGVNIRGVKVFTGEQTTKFFHRYAPNLVDREFWAEMGVADRLTPDLIPPNFLGASHVHMATAPPDKQIAIMHYLREQNPDVVISIDSIENYMEDHPDQVRQAFALSDIVFVNQKEHDLIAYVHSQRGGMVLKQGKDGATFIYNGERIHRPAPYVSNVVDTTGSGDVLAGAFMAQLAEGINPGYALEQAIATASRSITDVGVEHLLEAEVKSRVA